MPLPSALQGRLVGRSTGSRDAGSDVYNSNVSGAIALPQASSGRAALTLLGFIVAGLVGFSIWTR